jgi:hypothetical protein
LNDIKKNNYLLENEIHKIKSKYEWVN